MKLLKSLNFRNIERNTRWFSSNVYSDIIISSRVRIARNIEGFPFPLQMSEKQAELLLERIIDAIFSKFKSRKKILLYSEKLSYIEKQFLLERHIVSKEFVEDGLPKAVVIFPEEKVSIMINEEDHLRIQGIQEGLNLMKAWKKVDEIDSLLDEKLKFSFSSKFGYLTSCPTNVGTGLRASVLAHIPAIFITSKNEMLFSALEKIGIMIRGFYGEGSEKIGNILQFSTSETLGKSEEEIISELESVVKLIIMEERRERERIKKSRKLRERIVKEIEKIKRIDKINTEDSFSFLSFLALAKDLNIVSVRMEKINKLFFEVLPAHIQLKEGEILTEEERDFKRCELLKRQLGEICLKDLQRELN
ncbi:MAG: ATP--guanido phosphotransferase [Candidatus Omnitrophota bacterium]|nr:MAG: ATP--guanido phosphotransferase [Candidatus Omnitrophota bacterium]